jgi:hypothetical protein
MAAFWDPPPIPKRGDTDSNRTYLGVGMVISTWETIEFELARLYTVFVGRIDDDLALREYGDPAVFVGRLGELSKAAAQFFLLKPHQQYEGAYDRLTVLLRGFSERRNDVAHGTVFPIHTLNYFKPYLDPQTAAEPQYGVIPPYHTLNRHLSRERPAHCYAYAELSWLVGQLLKLAEAIRGYRNLLVPPELIDPAPTAQT